MLELELAGDLHRAFPLLWIGAPAHVGRSQRVCDDQHFASVANDGTCYGGHYSLDGRGTVAGQQYSPITAPAADAKYRECCPTRWMAVRSDNGLIDHRHDGSLHRLRPASSARMERLHSTRRKPRGGIGWNRPQGHHELARTRRDETPRQPRHRLGARPSIRAARIACGQDDHIGVERHGHDVGQWQVSGRLTCFPGALWRKDQSGLGNTLDLTCQETMRCKREHCVVRQWRRQHILSGCAHAQKQVHVSRAKGYPVYPITRNSSGRTMWKLSLTVSRKDFHCSGRVDLKKRMMASAKARKLSW